MANIRPLSHSIRFLFFIDALRARTNMGKTRIERIINEEWYKPYNLIEPSGETIAAYFKGTRPISYDQESVRSSSWLFACEMRFPGCARAFFHPLWNFLFGELQSQAKLSLNIQLVPEEWIVGLEAKGDIATANEWREANRKLKAALPRKIQKHPMDSLDAARATMFFLPDHIRDELFDCRGLASSYARTFRPVEMEIAALIKEQTIDSLAAILMLIVEAATIGDRSRLGIAKEAAVEHMKLLDNDKSFRRVKDTVKYAIHEYCIQLEMTRYSFVTLDNGLPDSWRPLHYLKVLNDDCERLMKRGKV